MLDAEKCLFEDSDENEIVEDSKREDVTDEGNDTFDDEYYEQKIGSENITSNETIKLTLRALPKPSPDDNLVICKLPPTFIVPPSPFVDKRQFLRENQHLLEELPTDITTISWRLKGGADEGVISHTSSASHVNINDIETNTHIVEWDDGSIVLYVGNIPLDIKSRKEVAYLLEDSNSEIKPIHARIEERLQIRFSNLLKNKSVHKKPATKRQKMTLTSISEALSSEISLQKQMVMMRENERLKRLQNSNVMYKGLTRNFLESDDESDQSN